MTPDTTVLTVYLTAKSVEALHSVVESTALSRIDVINRAIQLYHWWEEAKATGARHLLLQADEVAEVKIT